MGGVIKWSIILIGAVILVLNLFNLARRRLTPVIGVSWSIFAVLMLLFRSVLQLSELNKYMSLKAAVILILVIFAVIFAFYHLSIQISDLVDKINELNMQVSLLNAENARLNRAGRQEDGSGRETPEED